MNGRQAKRLRKLSKVARRVAFIAECRQKPAPPPSPGDRFVRALRRLWRRFLFWMVHPKIRLTYRAQAVGWKGFYRRLKRS